MRAWLFAIASCAVAPAPLPATHPANPSAPSGWLAGAPATLRPGTVAYPDVPPLHAPPPMHHHHNP